MLQFFKIFLGKWPFTGLLFLVLFLGCTPAKKLREGDGARLRIEESDYRRAENQLAKNLRDRIWNAGVVPEWLDEHRFWYRINTADGYRFMLVDAGEGTKKTAFDQQAVAEALQQASERPILPYDLPFEYFTFLQGESVIRFEVDGQIWECDLQPARCRDRYPVHQPQNSVLSPDGNWAAFILDHNLWIYDMNNREKFALTRSGVHRHGFATNSQGWFRSERPVLHWSPDSRKIATYRLDERDVQEMHLLKTAQDRPVLESWPYALPGDSIVPLHERVVLDVENRTKVWLDLPPSHQRTSNCCGLDRDGLWADIHWSPDASELAFVTTSRDYREVNLYVADTQSGEVRHVYEERARTFFESNLTSRGKPNWRILFDKDHFIWFSRRDEWGHLYLHRLSDGQRVAALTSGEWNVVDLLHVDEQKETIYFTGAGREYGRDPYFTHLYRLTWGEKEPVLLTPEDANHEISIGPGGKYFVDEFSSFRSPPVALLRNGSGEPVLPLEQADIRPLKDSGWIKPEPFTVKARDGETDLYGLLYKPSRFDDKERYPVIVNIYPGPQIGSVGTRSFSPARRGDPHALAELGFVVLQLDALGTPMRSKSFHTAWYGDMSDNGIEDQIAAIHQLSERYSWIDSRRAGIYGHSGGGYATISALLNHPGVFSVGVASAGNLDNRGYTYYWGEKYQGPRTFLNGRDSYRDQAIWKHAGRLQDHLLLSYGTMDSNVHPNMTLLFIDELIRENKNFDLIVMPNRGHGYASEPYHIRKTWDFFVRHLHGVDPPEGYRIR